MRAWLILSLVHFSLAPVWGDGAADVLFQRGLAFEQDLRPQEALEAFRAADEIRPNDPVILQKMARQLSDLTFIESDAESRRLLAEEALTYAKRAYELNPGSAEIVLSLAILHGKLGMDGGPGEKIRRARLVLEYADRAVELDPDYAWAHHVLGQWHVSVAGLGGTKRFFASMLFGRLPEASLVEGIRHLERAVGLAPGELAHRVELGFAYTQAKRAEEAREQWKIALNLPALGLEDGPAKARAKEALAAHG